MRASSVRASAFAVVVLWCGVSFTQDRPNEKSAATVVKDYENPGTALGLLQQAHGGDGSAFVAQDELDPLIHKDGGGACASAVCVDLMQVLRVMAGLDRLPDPHKAVLAAFKDQPELLAGRVTNE